MNRKYSMEFKNLIVSEICVLGKTRAEVAAQYNISIKSLENWITAYHKNPDAFNMNALPDEVKIKKLEKEISDLKIQNEILKKTLQHLVKKE